MTRYALVTGVTSGLGKAIVPLLIKDGWLVIGIGRDSVKLNESVTEFGKMFVPVLCDVSDRSAIERVSQQLKEQGIKPSLFLLNAGTGDIEPVQKIDLELHYRTFNVNYFGVMAWVDAWLQVGLEHGAIFVVISSILTQYATPGTAAYCASKSAVAAAFQSLRAEYIDSKVRFVRVFPGPVQTKMFKSNKPIPFVLTADSAAKILMNKLNKGRIDIKFPLFYRVVFTILNWLPWKVAVRLLR